MGKYRIFIDVIITNRDDSPNTNKYDSTKVIIISVVYEVILYLFW
ncbi:MAG: hypothetical protein ACI9RO_000614 [Alteromonas macleodii]|jgi:hypothetical protein